MWPCWYSGAREIPRRIWALHVLGLPYNKIVRIRGPVFSKEELLAEIDLSPSGSGIIWDDISFWLAPPEVRETWALMGWWDFQRWVF